MNLSRLVTVQICPLDSLVCDGANGKAHGDVCLNACKAGKDFVDKVTGLKRLRHTVGKNPEDKHGVAWWADDRKCPCDPCREASRNKNKERHRKSRERGGIQTERKPLVHATRYAWERRFCTCELCIEHKRVFTAEKNRKARDKNRARKQAAATGVHCGTDRTEAIESDCGERVNGAREVRV